MAEDDTYIFLTVQTRYDPEKLSYYCLAYNKKLNIGFNIKDNGRQGITDDILGGPPFWPLSITDDYYIAYIEAFELIEKTKDNNKMTAQLKNILSQIDENSNQLLILCKSRDRVY